MASFDDDFAYVDDMFDDVFGTEEIIVTTMGGEEYTFSSIVGDETVEQRTNEMGTETIVARGFDIPVDKDGRDENGQRDVLDMNGTVTLGSVLYAIEKITSSKSGMATLHCKRISTAEKSRENYRRRL